MIVLYGIDGVIHNIGGWHICSDKGAGWQGKFTQLDLASGDPFRKELEHFGECLLNGKGPLTSGRDNLKTMAVIEAICSSAKEGQRIKIAQLLER